MIVKISARSKLTTVNPKKWGAILKCGPAQKEIIGEAVGHALEPENPMLLREPLLDATADAKQDGRYPLDFCAVAGIR